jgi:hypothetical protein
MADVQLRVYGEHPIGQELSQLRLRPALHDELRDLVQVRARVDVVRNAGADDRQDRSGALTAEIQPREEPIPSSQDQSAKLSFPAIV